MITVQTSRGFEFWPDTDVAVISPEFRDWWTVVHADGRVAHLLASSVPDFGVPLGAARVNPAHLKRTAGGLLDPAQFVHPLTDLQPLPEVAPAAAADWLPCHPSHIYALRTVSKKWVWHTDQGEFPMGRSTAEAVQAMPDLFLLKKGIYLNRTRLRRIRIEVQLRFFCLDNGLEYQAYSEQPGLAERLGLPNLTGFSPRLTGRIEFGLRDWPWDLVLAPASFLKANFTNPRQLIAHLIWQRYRQRSLGYERSWCKGYDSFWYEVVAHVMQRAGFLREEEVNQRVSLELSRRDSRANELYYMMYSIMDVFVDEGELFNYREFGFVDPEPWQRSIGEQRPGVVLYSEKGDLAEYSRLLAGEFGVSYCQLEGMPWRLRSEYLAADLLARGIQSVHAIIYADYDDGGYWVGQASVEQLARLGITVASVQYMILENTFTAEEKSLHAKPCGGAGKILKSRARNWVARGFGIGGECKGIHANHVQPFERVRQLFLNCLEAVSK